MKKYIHKLKVLIKVKTNEIHWFFIGCLCTIGYKELFLDRPYDYIDIIAIPFFGLLGGVVFYQLSIFYKSIDIVLKSYGIHF